MSIDDELLREALAAYEVGGQLGRGGGGIVLSGRHRQLGHAVAIKQIPRQFATDPDVQRRFTAEARLLASIDHPHVVPVYDFVHHHGLFLLVMELLPGGTVRNRCTEVGFDAPSAVAVALACAAGLQAAHEHGILHRDVKPENLMFAASGALKVTDFGIAQALGEDGTAARAGEVLGTPSYIAPEQARCEELSPSTDVYALATVLYELLAGVLPFPRSEDSTTTLSRHAFEAPMPLAEVAPAIPQPLAAVIMRGLASDPAKRFVSAESFGVARAAAAARCWGPGWPTARAVQVMGADTIVSAAVGGAWTSAMRTVHSGVAMNFEPCGV